MSQYQKVIKKIGLVLGVFLAGMVAAYVVIGLYKKAEQADNLISFGGKLWAYKLYASNNSVLTFGNVVTALGLIFFGFYISRLLSESVISRLLNKTKLNKGAQAAIQNLSHYTLIILCTLLAFEVANVPLTMFTIFGGALAIGFGFGSQNLLSNFISGIILQIERPVKVGDYVEIEGNLGTVEHIGGRSTKLVSNENKHIVIPNSYFLDKKFVNWTLNDSVVRCKMELEFDMKDDPEKVLEMLRDIVKGFDKILKYPEPRLYFSDIGGYSFKYVIYFWVSLDSSVDRLEIESKIRIQVVKEVKIRGFNLPLPTQLVQIQRDKFNP